MVSAIEFKEQSIHSKEVSAMSETGKQLKEMNKQSTAIEDEEITLMSCSLSLEDASNYFLEDEVKFQINHEGSFLSLSVDVSASNIICRYSVLIFGLTTFFGILLIMTLLTLMALTDLEEISWLTPFLQRLLFIEGAEEAATSQNYLRGSNM